MKNKRGQTSLEYALLVAAIVAALVAMYGIISYTSMGRLKQGADAIGEGEQYEPGVTQVK